MAFGPTKAAEAASPSAAAAERVDAARSLAATRGYPEQAPNPLLDPRSWLALAILAAVLAIAAHVRLRAT